MYFNKNGALLRPIVNTIFSPTFGLAKFLTKLLKPLVGRTNSFIKDSMTWINEIHKEKLNKEDILVSFDVTSLYTKIPLNEAIETIRELTDERFVCALLSSHSKINSMSKWRVLLWDPRYPQLLLIYVWKNSKNKP